MSQKSNIFLILVMDSNQKLSEITFTYWRTYLGHVLFEQ